MSCFIVCDRTINRIVTFMDRAMSGNGGTLEGMAKRVMDKWGLNTKPKTIKELDLMALALLKLNEKAFDEKYSDKTQDAIEYEYTSGTPIEIFKAISVYTYQIAEGDIPNTKIYKCLEEMALGIASHIVHTLPEFDKCEQEWN